MSSPKADFKFIPGDLIKLRSGRRREEPPWIWATSADGKAKGIRRVRRDELFLVIGTRGTFNNGIIVWNETIMGNTSGTYFDRA